jgi:hypothetical protein
VAVKFPTSFLRTKASHRVIPVYSPGRSFRYRLAPHAVTLFLVRAKNGKLRKSTENSETFWRALERNSKVPERISRPPERTGSSVKNPATSRANVTK